MRPTNRGGEIYGLRFVHPAASATDFFDGWLARRLDCASNLAIQEALA
ncbi:CDP-alcohol phosphatidyltransferase family protein [uncultured Lamprocystis sp.]|jgi:hypothetical protein|nr:CDP-alcohol phosphatidyltransferase family protein [uncultured Lamprocystis sp.]